MDLKLDKPRCYKCGAELSYPNGAPGRRDSCGSCGADVRVCKNCRHYDPKAYNECREPQADRVVEKEKGNFCDFFSLGAAGGAPAGPSKESILKSLDDLFKK